MTRSTPTMSAISALLLMFCVGPGLVNAGGDGGWITGRTTWYDDAPWMSVHKGSCMYGFLGDRFGGSQNWHVGAMNDGNAAFSGCCGKCFEVKCEPMVFNDAFGNQLDRTSDCRSTTPIIITITDSCPCVKPENKYSNQRWCCGDMNHFDIGIWAFKRLADPGKGVVGIKYRPVACPGGAAPSVVNSEGPSDKSG